MSAPSVLFVSKPIVPPFHDGAKCLVRDVATRLPACGVAPTVLGTHDAPPLGAGVTIDRVHPRAGGFAPGLAENARVFARLTRGARADVWHFVFAPNPLSSGAARAARLLRPTPTVQTVASAPRSFERVGRLLFGDRVVTTSAWTRERLVGAGADAARVSVVAPTVAPLPAFSQGDLDRARRDAGVEHHGPLVLYPGDVEMSCGARVVAGAVPRILASLPDAVVVFACRKKTPRAHEAEQALRAALAPHGERVRFVGEVRDLVPLIAASSVVAFPVDDLYGKVDLPIALLEAMALGVPLVTLAGGPLGELGASVELATPDADRLADACVSLVRDRDRHAELAARGREAVARRHRPEVAAAAYAELYRALLAR